MKLLLFDIDGTLVLSGGAGARAMTRAFEEIFGGPGVDAEKRLAGVPMAGRTDTWIVGEMARITGAEPNAETLRRFHARYIEHLKREIHEPGPRKGVLPGVRPLLDVLASRDDAHLALLTGNFAMGAEIKLQYFDLWQYFACGAFAEDASDRNALFGHALSRVVGLGGPRFDPSQVVVIGDTPLDIAVAKAGGGRSVAVATGSYTRAALEESGPDAALDDLSDLDRSLRALGFEI